MFLPPGLVASATASLLNGGTASVVSGSTSCFQNQPLSATGALSSSTLTSGLAFSIMAWLVDFLAVLLAILCIVETTNSVLASRKLLAFSRMPATLFCFVVALSFRIIAVACAYNWTLAQLNVSSPDPTIYTTSFQTNASPILLLISIGFGAITMFMLAYAVHLARHETPKVMGAPTPAAAVVAAAPAPAAPVVVTV